MPSKKFIIKSVERSKDSNLCYFVAIHGYSPMYSVKEKAKRFDDREKARIYAITELFIVTPIPAYKIESVDA